MEVVHVAVALLVPATVVVSAVLPPILLVACRRRPALAALLYLGTLTALAGWIAASVARPSRRDPAA